jgi:hypothetical protein
MEELLNHKIKTTFYIPLHVARLEGLGVDSCVVEVYVCHSLFDQGPAVGPGTNTTGLLECAYAQGPAPRRPFSNTWLNLPVPLGVENQADSADSPPSPSRTIDADLRQDLHGQDHHP